MSSSGIYEWAYEFRNTHVQVRKHWLRLNVYFYYKNSNKNYIFCVGVEGGDTSRKLKTMNP